MCAMISGLFIGSNDGRPPNPYKENLDSLTNFIEKTQIGLVLLRLNVPVNIFSVMSGRSHRFLGITSTFRGVNMSLLKDTTRLR